MNRLASSTIERLRWYENALKLKSEAATLVEVGSGDGSQAAEFARHFHHVHAIDANGSVGVEHHRENLTHHLGTILSEVYVPDREADFLFCDNVLEHITPESLVPFMKDCSRMLKPGGGAFFSWSPIWSPIGQHVGNRFYTWEHIRRDPDGWSSFLAEKLGDAYRDMWLDLEWRPGLLRRDWLQLGEVHLTIEDVMHAASAAGLHIVSHSIQTARTNEFLSLTDAGDLLQRATLIDFTCESDSYLFRKVL